MVRLFIFLTNKISEEEQGNLLRSLQSDQAISCRFEISRIVETFSNGEFDKEKYTNLVELLPLTGKQKTEV